MRGETGRVAARVRELLGEPASPAPDESRPSLGQRLLARVPVRLDPGRRAALGIGLAVAVAAVATGIWLAADRPRVIAVASSPAAAQPALLTPAPSGASSAPVSAAASSATELVVDVAGKVRQPGVYRLPAGSRVDDAVRKAGGALRGTDLTSLNLAAKLSDGQQVVVGAPAGAAAPGAAGMSSGGGSAGGGSGGLVSLNSATLDQLESLPGVGPVLAQHILEYRDAHGGFRSVDQLNDVSGIGEVKYAALKPLVTV